MTYIATYLLGVITFGVFMLAKMRHRTPPPTLYRRRGRDRLHEVRNVPPMPVCKPARDADFAEVGGIRYEHLGMTGEEV